MRSEMGKLAAYLVGLVSAIALSYYVLSISYSPLIGWLGPVSGPSMMYVLSLLFLLFGNVLSSPALFATWVAVGVLIGLVGRKGTKAIGAAIAVYFSVWLFLGISALAMAQNISGVPGTGGISPITTNFHVPPMPPGVTVSAILSEPLFQPLLSVISSIVSLPSFGGVSIGGVSGATGYSTGSVVSTLVRTFVPYMLINLAILLVVSGLVGRAIHSVLHPRERKRKGSSERGNGSPKSGKEKKSEPEGTSGFGENKVSITTGTVLALLIAVMFLMIPFNVQAPVSNGQGNEAMAYVPNADGVSSHALLNATLSTASLGMAGESSAIVGAASNVTGVNSLDYGAGIVSKNGNIYNLYAFLNVSSNNDSQLLIPSSVAQPILSLLVVSNNLSDIFSALAADGIINVSAVDIFQSNQYFNLIPQAILILAFKGNLSTSSGLASRAATNLSGNIGGSSLSRFFAISVNLSQNSGNTTPVSLYAFSLSSRGGAAENYVLQRTPGRLPQDGMFTVFRDGINSGYLIPGESGSSVNGSIFIAGQIDVSNFSAANLTSMFNGTIPSTSSGNLFFMGGLFERNSVIHSSSTTHTLTGSQIFNYDSSITFGVNSTVYGLTMIYPYVNESQPSHQPEYRAIVYSTVSNLTLFVSADNTTYHLVDYGFTLDFSGVSQTTNNVFPADLSISVRVSRISGNSFNVTISVRNNDTSNIENSSLSGNILLGSYGQNMVMTSGSPTVNLSLLPPGENLTLTYDLSVSGVGVYYVANPIFNYTLNNRTFSVTGQAVAKSAQAPSFWSSSNEMTLTAFTVIFNAIHFPALVHVILPGFYVFDLIFVLLAALAVYLEYRAFSRWRRSKRKVE